MTNGKVWFITGCSMGFGRTIAEATLAAGYRVVVTALDESDVKDLATQYPKNCRVAKVDVTKPDTIARAVALAEREFGGIDVLVNNAGYAVMGAIEENTPDEFRPMFEVNVFGLISMTQAVLPVMRKRRRGCIVNFSSIAGFVAYPGFGYYAASKFAVEGLSEALAAEVKPLGIRVIIVEPAPFRTNFRGDSMKRSKVVIADYAETSGKTRAFTDAGHGTQAGDPQKGAKAIMTVVESDTPPLRLPLGPDAYTLVRGKLAAVEKDLEGWENVGANTSFDDK